MERMQGWGSLIQAWMVGVMACFCTLAVAGNEEAISKPSSAQAGAVVELLRQQITQSNQQLAKPSQRIRLFAQMADHAKSEQAGYLVPSRRVVSVANPDSWPEETVTSYILLLREDGRVAAFTESPVSESGDWDNSYTHYYDERGETVAFERRSSFFMGCASESATETSHYFYGQGKLLAKDYTLTDGNNKALKPSQCEFMYRHPYTIHRSWPESQRATGIPLRK